MASTNLAVKNNDPNNTKERFLTDEDFLKIPGIYFGATSELIEKFGVKEIAKKGGDFVTKVGFGV
ncbi:hypothetical protein [Campylobacter showae]|uniref:hypothetical protein n=1 Tax=Campylobacter showae TaxID=204 RepID=UPI003C6EBFC2